MKHQRIVTAFSAALVAAAIATPSFAQNYEHRGGDPDSESSRGLSGGDPAMTLHEFLNNNPDFARRYHENPNIIYDHETMEHEPGFRAYLREHPEVEARLYGGRPGYNREGRWEGNHGLSGGAPDITLREFLNNNPDFARRYHENPNIIYDHETMEHEPGFRAYLREHPDVEAQLYGGRPGYNREGRWEGNRGEALNSKFLNEHPNLAKQLRDNPSLVNDPEFVRTHPNLREYLRNNPEAR